MYKREFRHLPPTSCCNNCIYKRISPKTMLEFQVKRVIAQMSMIDYQITEWEEICVEKEYERCLTNEVARSIKTSNLQQLACKAVLDNFAINTWLDNYTDEFKFLLKWRLKPAKQGAKITSIDKLR